MGEELTDRERAAVAAVVGAVVPEERKVLESLVGKAAPWWRRARPSRAVGYGVDEAVQLVSLYAVVATISAVSIVYDEARDIVEARLRRWTKKLFDRAQAPPGRRRHRGDCGAGADAHAIYGANDSQPELRRWFALLIVGATAALILVSWRLPPGWVALAALLAAVLLWRALALVALCTVERRHCRPLVKAAQGALVGACFIVTTTAWRVGWLAHLGRALARVRERI
jgi:Flp pilus assembly protein TadB